MSIEICKYDDCTGCFACANGCPVNCISIEPDKYGELHPIINDNKCIKCHKCIKICPGNKTNIQLLKPLHCYAAYRLDKEKRADSASGGIGALLSEYIVQNKGVVFGVKFNEKLIPIHSSGRTPDEIEAFKGSKYVQSRINFTFKEAKAYLDKNITVLFVGTPCQISGLKSYLGNKQYSNLITCDLICHGVSSYKFLQEHIQNIGLNNIKNIAFRGNSPKSNYRFRLFDKNSVVYNRRGILDNYFYGFLRGISLRNSCHKCKYAQSSRISDITIGDFLGLKSDFKGNPTNVSVILTNTEKGNNILKEINKFIYLEERTYIEAVNGGVSLRHPFPKHHKREEFRQLYTKIQFEKAMNKVALKYQFKDFIILLFNFIKRNLKI